MSLRGCLSRLPLRRPLTRRPCVRACCWFALLLLVLQIVAFACWCRTSSCRRARRLQPKPQTDVFGKHGGKSTGKHPCTRQDLARRVQEVAIKQLETVQQAVTTAQQAVTTAQEVVGRLTTLWLAELPSGSEKANLLKQELNEAQQNYGMAQQKYAEAQQKYEEAQQNCKAASASIQAGRVQAGASACAVVAVDFGLQHSRVRFRAVQRLCFLGSCSALSKGHLVVKLQAQSTGCPLCFAILQNGVSVPGSRLGGQPVFRSL